MRILLTGSTGSIGSGVLKALRQNGHEVTCPVRSLSKVSQSDPLIHYVEIDNSLDDYSKFNSLAQGYQGIIHTGFAMGPHDAEMETRVLTGLLDAAKIQAQNEKVTFIFTSGCLAYGNHEQLANDDEIGNDNVPDYNIYRVEHEKIALAAANDNLHVCIIRPGFVYGGSFVDHWFSACKKEGKVVAPTGNNHMIFIHKDDLGILYRLAAENFARGVFLGGESHCLTIDEIVDIAKRVAGTEVVERVPDVIPFLGTFGFVLYGMLNNQNVDSRRARVELGFVPSFNISRDSESALKID